MAMTTLSTTIDGNSAGRVDVVVRQLSESSHSQVRGMVDSGCVSINGAIILSGAATVVVGDLVSLRFDPTQGYREKKKCWDDRTFTVSFEDDHLIVVDKSAGTLTVPTDRNEINTLVDRVSIYLGHSRGKREAWLVHRLDRDVSGLVIFGKHKQVATRLIEQFKQRKPARSPATKGRFILIWTPVRILNGTSPGHLQRPNSRSLIIACSGECPTRRWSK